MQKKADGMQKTEPRARRAHQPDPPPKPARIAKIPYRKSMAKKISRAYLRMFSNWAYGILGILLALAIALNGYFYYDNMERIRREIARIPSETWILEQTMYALSQEQEESPLLHPVGNAHPLYPLPSEFALVNGEGVLVMEPGTSAGSVAVLLRQGTLHTGPFSFRFVFEGNRLWMGMPLSAHLGDWTVLEYRYAADITIPVAEMILFFGAGFFLVTLGMGVITLQGRFSTRRTLRMIDELTGKISAISSQNLNLRLNVRDSTDELVDLAVTFNRMMERLEHAYGKQNQFVSDASHELRTPISVIQGYARMLERWGKSDPAILDEAISAISKESRNMQDLVEKLLFIARNDRDSLVLVMEPFDLSEMMKELGRETAMLETGHRLVCQVQEGIRITGDRNRLKQSLRVFLDNALKFTESSGTITLRLVMNGDTAEATIRDTGIGIPEQALANVFDRFYRVDSARERNTGGHGLGLSIARIIVLRHGGKITVGSKVGAGTRFTVHLPLRGQDTAVSAPGPLPKDGGDCT